MPIQQMLLGVGAAKKTYIDDIFSTYVYEGDGTTSHQIVNGIDLASNGGMIWGKERGNSGSHYLFDTARGLDKRLKSNSNSVEETDTFYSSVNSNGYTINKVTSVNVDGNDYASWTFRKAPGFFDVVAYTGAGGTQTVNHNLGCVPGCIIIKKRNSTNSWKVYHRGTDSSSPENYALTLESTAAREDFTYWNDTAPTSTQFTVADSDVNSDGGLFIAYLFAGGKSTTATARSVDFDGDDYLSLASSSDLSLDSDFTVEFWFNSDDQTGSNRRPVIGDNLTWGSNFAQIQTNHPSHVGKIVVWDYNMNSSAPVVKTNKTYAGDQWHHVAVVRSSNVWTIYVNGIADGTATQSGTFDLSNSGTLIGKYNAGTPSYYFDGKISNLRVVKGTAVYTSSFRPPTEPLTNITNTKLLCCNNSSTTGSTVTPGTITANGDPTASTDSPFDDPAGFVFGESGSENVIKCGSYKTDSNEDATIDLGWEPQWVLAKRTDSSSGGPDWLIYDSMRGFMNAQDIKANNGGSKSLSPNLSDSENDNSRLGLTSTGAYADQYGSNRSFIYVAIRRSDGYVGKPSELGTEVFTMDVGSSSSTIPTIDTGFPVDFGLTRPFASTSDWVAGSRLTGIKAVFTNSGADQTDYSNQVWDSNVGFWKAIQDTWQAWAWKRHAGFDVVTYVGDGVAGRQLPHSMNKAPEMVWIKLRDKANHDWVVGHKGLDGGTNPWQKWIKLNENEAEADQTWPWNDTAPTANHLVLGNGAYANGEDDEYIAMLFASVDGISKVGYFSGSNSSQTITTGFQPRFLIIKNATLDTSWQVLDTTRGWASGNDKRLFLDTTSDQSTGDDVGQPTSTGFTLTGGDTRWNGSSHTFIYYAHA
jgi:hypothetical protein